MLTGLLVVSTVAVIAGCNLNADKSQSGSINSTQSEISVAGNSTASQTASQNASSTVNNSTQNSSVASAKSSASSATSGGYTAAQQLTLKKASNVINWQLDNGGWGKNYDTTSTFTKFPSDYCWTVSGKFVGTIDNKATYTEMRILAEAYDISKDKKFKNSFDKGMGFLKKLQYSSGGFGQIYPRNGKYNDYVTFNDDAMVNVLYFLQDIANNKAPFKNITDETTRKNCATMVSKGVDYILKSQITVKGEKAAWCAQHDPTSYKPMKARSYELPSVSGSESVGIIKFLKTQANNREALDAAEAARKWLVAHRIENTAYSKSSAPNSFTTKQGSYCWYRFYDLTDGRGFFCTRAGKVYYNFAEFCAADYGSKEAGKYDRANGYDWAGSWLQKAGLNY